MEAGGYGLTRGTCFVVHRLEVVAIAGLLLIRGVHWVRRDDSAFFQIRRSSAVSVDSVKGQRQPANLPTEKSRPPIPSGVSFLVLIPENYGVS